LQRRARRRDRLRRRSPRPLRISSDAVRRQATA